MSSNVIHAVVRDHIYVTVVTNGTIAASDVIFTRSDDEKYVSVAVKKAYSWLNLDGYVIQITYEGSA